MADQINSRFVNARITSDLAEIGVLMHQFDGWEDPDAPWRPCLPHASNGTCAKPDAKLRQQRVSTSIIYAGMRRPDRPDRKIIPTFSLRGGVVLRPSRTKLLCGYGVDGAVDYGKGAALAAGCPGRASATRCVPGCGNPPQWCLPNELEDPGQCQCSFGWCGGGSPRPFRPEDFDTLIRKHAEYGELFGGIGSYKGYNEIIVESAHWIEQLPWSIEAFFVTAGGDAKEMLLTRRAHQAFLRAYGLRGQKYAPPLLRYRPDRWDAPFELMEAA